MSDEAREPGGLVPGRIVYYRLFGAKNIVTPAVILSVYDGPGKRVSLRRFDTLEVERDIAYSPRVEGNTWHWMFEGQENRYSADRPESPKPGDVVIVPKDGPFPPVHLDPRIYRSASSRCSTCVWWVRKDSPELSPPKQWNIGFCRRHAPTMGGCQVTYGQDWCGEHKLDENKA